MRWRLRLPRAQPHRLCVVGLDIGPQVCSLVVVSGPLTHADGVYCAESLPLPEGVVVQGEVLQPEVLGPWLRTHVQAAGYAATAVYMGLDNACVVTHHITLAAGLLPDDVAFQLQAEVAAIQPQEVEVCIHHRLDAEPAPTGEQGYVVQAVPRVRVEALQRLARAAGWRAAAVEPREGAADRAQLRHSVLSWSPEDAAHTGACDVALGLALRAWHREGVNFLPDSDEVQHLLRRACIFRSARFALGGGVGAVCLALVMSWLAAIQTQQLGDMAALTHASAQAQKEHTQAQAIQQRHTAQAQWLQSRQAVQAQTLQWSGVLSHAAHGVWVAHVTQQGAHWSVQGEALSPAHVQQLVQQLKALHIWAKPPELPQLQRLPTVSSAGLPVWQFRMDADLTQAP
ncbi:pilus assembly protein PilM [Limnohabitans sp.]|uniref:pilus assembly protein PilM n=1 Tax=Limnohabitans sp. TaxID=1907725 RepID=UPI00286FAC14|nr:pilus assembly protein PilM [Limnohabitans sp.]